MLVETVMQMRTCPSGTGGDLGWNGSVRYHRLFPSNPRKVSGNWIGVFLIVDYVD